MRWVKSCLALMLLISSFGYGIGVGLYGWFPFDEIRMAKGVFDPDRNSNASHVTQVEINTLNEQLIAVEASRLRDSLLQFIVPIDEIDVSVTSNAEFEIFEARYHGVNVRGEFYHASTQPACLRIYVQGHGGNPNNFSYHNQLRDDFINGGCDVLSLSMLGLGLNVGEASFPTRFGAMVLTEEQATNHGNYSFFHDEKNLHLDALSLFLYPHMRLIKHAINQGEYENVSILGISGGGWYTVWLAALMPELDVSISYAGSLPFAYRNDANHHGDWEQVYSPIYRSVSFLQLYQLMLLNELGNQTRQAFLVYNDNDSCCFMNPAAFDFKTRIDNLEFYPQVIIDENNSHSMNVPLVLRLLQHE